MIIGLDYGGQQSRLVGLQPFGMVQWGDHLKEVPAYSISQPIVFDQNKDSPLSIDIWHHIDSLLVPIPLGQMCSEAGGMCGAANGPMGTHY